MFPFDDAIMIKVILLSFREFALLGDTSECQSVGLRYYDGDRSGRTPRTFCGSRLPNITRSSGHVVEFELYFSGHYSWSGFRIDYGAVDSSSEARYPVIDIGN